MDRLDYVVDTFDHILDSKRKRHIIGGVMLSVSLLFGGLAFTTFTIGLEDHKNE